MSVYYVNKFLFQVDRDPELLAAYKASPAELVDAWDADLGRRLGNGDPVERTTWLRLEPEERTALIEHDYVALFEMGAHFFLCLTIFIAIYDEDYSVEQGPLSFQREYAAKLSHWLGKDYPPVAL
ncbi:hypothetical protein NY547_00995 [Cnuibacter physcomitrellae]|uniref:hypothetical protein n=1 Tax=Cnuibacter physcomitrellae TaxID=1619308 RepID=UPI002175FDAC|nr:hypothetical protein [Cnuibacter physcomitrellae]MCS5495815.1 hypothetical protein [Cnuibacter physcomitrellae]